MSRFWERQRRGKSMEAQLLLLFTRAIRKSASSMLSAASQLFLLIKWRSLRTLSSDFRASTESELRRVRVNCNENMLPVDIL